jgi:hypothetical protein
MTRCADGCGALDQGSSLILFPEGQRNSSDSRSSVQVRSLPPCQEPPAVRPCSGLDRQPQPCHAQGRSHSRAADLHPDLRLPRFIWPRRRRTPSLPAPPPALLALSSRPRVWHDLAPSSLAAFGVGAILILASVIGEILRLRLAPNGENPVIENLNARINRLVGDGDLLAIAFIAGRAGVVLLFALCSFAALREFLTLTTHNRADHWSLVACFFVILPLQYWFLWIDWYGMYSIFVPVYAFLLLPVLSALSGRPRIS